MNIDQPHTRERAVRELPMHAERRRILPEADENMEEPGWSFT